jgi:hypothetical protein
MKTIKIKDSSEIPENFTGIVEFSSGTKCWFKDGKFHRENGPAREWADGTRYWYKNGKWHREDGPACDYSNGTKFWYLEGIYYKQISLENYIVLDSYKGKYNLVWYKLLGKDEIFDYPEILGLIEK